MTPDTSGLTVIGASAGTGKTHRLTELVWAHCRPGGPVPPDGLVAVTFTEKAAAELGDRIRQRLFGERAAAAADRLGLAWLGTVHAVGWRLVAEHAFEACLPMDHQLLDGEAAWALDRIVEHAVPDERVRLLEDLAERLMVRWDSMTKRSDWMKDVFDIVQAARANRIGSAELAAMAARSRDGLLAFLPPADEGRDLEAELRAARAALVIPPEADKKSTHEAVAAVDQALDEIARGRWCGWQRVLRAKPTVKALDAFAPLYAIAAAHLAHPRFRGDLTQYLREAYAAAADILDAYADWKKAHRIIDYADMLDQALVVLDVPAVAELLRERMAMVVVDELQDSGPLQLALFARLHALVGRSFWVGDPKQCIFEWAGADPALMDALLAEVEQAAPAREPERLTVNYRSRAALVRGCSALFEAAFATVDVAPADVRATPCEARQHEPAALAALPPMGVMPLIGAPTAALADGIIALLADPAKTPVLDRVTGAVRPLEARDVAVLLRSNEACTQLASALEQRGVRATTWRRGLLATREGRLTLAALRLLVAERDDHAEAELEALAGFEGFGADGEADPEAGRRAWLEARLGERSQGRFEAKLGALRGELAALTPAGVLERVYEALDVVQWAGRFPDAAQAVANLDALRGVARGYEAEAGARGGAATLSGLLRALDRAARAGRAGPRGRAQDDARDAQHVSEGADAVHVTTYHRAKGLEWPVVILGSLDHDAKREPFEVWAESEAKPTLAAPLAGRWVRYWPWPYGSMRSGALRDAVMQSDVGTTVSERERRERIRLLYVGFTRARDHLVLALGQTKTGFASAWLDTLQVDGRALVELRPDQVVLAGHAVCARWLMGVPGQRVQAAPVAPVVTRPAGDAPVRGPRRLAPSGASAADVAGATLVPGEVVELGPPLPLTVRGDAQATRAGLALHGFLASDDLALARATRLTRAERWLVAEDAVGALGAAAMLEASERLARFVASRWPGGVAHAELPVRATLGERALQGTIDLLVEVAGGFVVIDHKSNYAADLHPAARSYAPQLGAYQAALAVVDANASIDSWLHFPLAGRAVRMVLLSG